MALQYIEVSTATWERLRAAAILYSWAEVGEPAGPGRVRFPVDEEVADRLASLVDEVTPTFDDAIALLLDGGRRHA